MSGAGEHNQDDNFEPLPLFRSFEERAAEIGTRGLAEAVRRISYPENTLDLNEAGSMWFSIARPYTALFQKETDDAAARAAYNALYFAMAVRNQLVGTRMLPLYPFDWGQDAATIKERIVAITSTFFETRPTLQDWTNRHLGQLDPSGEYPNIVIDVTGVTLAQYEQYEKQGFIDVETALHMGNTSFNDPT